MEITNDVGRGEKKLAMDRNNYETEKEETTHLAIKNISTSFAE